ncbi:TniQ family protein [Enterocloster clostridioformis]|uniref:TniQ family protein n=1 Tax=Enterocloster clostridioformis TaxID=1531 RepID=UPI0022E6AE45|nr:TniQ family protein [Enterocloster clostridioformis]
MLQYFPTPYPDELWYSVLCRYHVRSGNPTSAMTFRELFNGKDHAALGSFLPNRLIFDIASQLPEGTLDIEDIALNHTLFKYMFRFQSLESKNNILDMTKYGKIDFPVKISKPYESMELKSCPLCMQEDMKKYGEIYWHLSHQIPYVSICQKHKCCLNIRQREYKNELNNNFVLPDINDMNKVDYDVSETELEFSKMLIRYLELPLEAGPIEGYSNLYEGLLNAGYGIVRKDMNYSIDYKRLSRDLCNKYGEEFITQHFGNTVLGAALFGKIRRWLKKYPEQYAILAMFINQEPEVTFSHTRIENDTNKRFVEMSKAKITRSKKFVAEKLGVKDIHLDIISHNLGIEPFWETKPKTENPKSHKLSFYFTKPEWDYINECVNQYGFSSASAFIRYCVDEMKNSTEKVG